MEPSLDRAQFWLDGGNAVYHEQAMLVSLTLRPLSAQSFEPPEEE